MARVLAVAADLMLASRVRTALEAQGHEVTQARDLSGRPLDGFELIVADLDSTPAEELAGAPVPVLGFHQHTDVETKRRAEQAGIEVVVPRSRMVRELPQLAEGLLAAE